MEKLSWIMQGGSIPRVLLRERPEDQSGRRGNAIVVVEGEEPMGNGT